MLFIVNERVISSIIRPPKVIVNKFSVSVSVSFFSLLCIKGQVIRVFLDATHMTLLKIGQNIIYVLSQNLP